MFCACRRPGLFPYAPGLLLASKQYMVLAALPALLAVPRPWRITTLLKVAAAGRRRGAGGEPAADPVEPLGLLGEQLRQRRQLPFADGRPELPAAARDDVRHRPRRRGSAGWRPGPDRVGPVATTAWPPASPRAVAAACLGFFAFGKLAFCNYYYFIIAALCCAAASAPPRRASRIEAIANPRTKTRRRRAG